MNYEHASSSLRRTLTGRLASFVPYPHQLVDIVTAHGAVFGGEFALTFVLRDKPFRPNHLDIYASDFAYTKLYEAILDDPAIQPCIRTHTFVIATLFDALRRLVTETITIHMKSGATIHIHQSYTCSPCAPITRSPCTALSNFVTAYGFGCSHPELTLSSRALIADRELEFISPNDAATLNHLLAHDFSLAVSPTAWPEFRRVLDDDTLQSAAECWRTRYVCPNQGRYFGDKGSFVEFFDPLGGDETRCAKDNMAPFGPMVIWRLASSMECEDGCEFLDEALEQGVTSIPVLFRKDPYGELHDCIYDHHTRSHPLYRTFGRRRSLSV